MHRESKKIREKGERETVEKQGKYNREINRKIRCTKSKKKSDKNKEIKITKENEKREREYKIKRRKTTNLNTASLLCQVPLKKYSCHLCSFSILREGDSVRKIEKKKNKVRKESKKGMQIERKKK